MPRASSSVPSSLAILLLCGGCYANRAVYDPYSFAPKTPNSAWKPPARLHPMALSTINELPEQEEPFSMAELLDIALKNNPQTKITWAKARSAAAAYGQTQGNFLPVIAGNWTYLHSRVPSFFPSGDNVGPVTNFLYTQWGPQLSLTYTIFDFGQNRSTTEAARQALYYADWTHNRAIQTLIQTVTIDYYNYQYARQLLEAYRQNVATAQTTLDAAEASLNSGVKDISDFLQAQTQLLQNQTSWTSQQQNVEVALATLLTNMGLSATTKINLQELPFILPDIDIVPDIDSLIEIALEYRPDLLAAEANVRSKDQTLFGAFQKYFPTLNYSFDISQTNFGQGQRSGFNYNSTVSLNVPIFSGFSDRNGVKIAEANKSESEESLYETQLNVVKEVTTSRSNVRISYDTLMYATAYLTAAEKQYDVALHQYIAGTTDILTVVSAQSSLADARAQQVSAYQQWYSALTNLAYSTGTLCLPPLRSQDYTLPQVILKEPR